MWNDYHNNFSSHSLSHINFFNGKEKQIFCLVMRNLRVYFPNSFEIYHMAVLTIVIMLYITSLVIISLITESFYLLTTSLKFTHPSLTPLGTQIHCFSMSLFPLCFSFFLKKKKISHISDIIQGLSLSELFHLV